MKNFTNNTIALGGLFAASAALLSAFESALPPLPLVPPICRLGLSNVAVMLAARHISPSASLFTSLVRSFLVLLVRGFTAFLLSLTGGIFSTLVIILIFKFKSKSLGCIGAGVLGAAVHNAAQIAVYALIIGETAWFFLPVLLVFSVISGCLTGWVLFVTEKYII